MSSPMDKLDKDVSITIPAKFVPAIVRALSEAALMNLAYLSEADDMTNAERLSRAACVECYKEVNNTFRDLMETLFTSDDLAQYTKFAEQTIDLALADKGSVN